MAKKKIYKTCKNCDKPIRYAADLQRYEHIHNLYDECYPRIGPRQAGQTDTRAEPK